MNFLNRLKFYLLGFILGLFLVYGIFKERNWDWLPENKVKKFLLENPLKIFYNKKQDLLSDQLSKKIFDIIVNGDVNFSKSETKQELKIYLIEYKQNTAIFNISFKDTLCRILSLDSNYFKKESNSKDSTIFLDQMNLFLRFDKLEKKYSKSFIKKLENYPLNEEDFSNNLKSFEPNWAQSDPYKKSNPQYLGTIIIHDSAYFLILETGNQKLRFKDFYKI
jgi:hypothetical protein